MSDTIFTPEENCEDYHLVVTTTSTAHANGYDTNSAIAQLSLHGQLLEGYPIYYTLSGDARFTNGAQHISVSTDSQGEAAICFTDTRPETVIITCSYSGIEACESISFTNPPVGCRYIRPGIAK
ncbi:Ig-like domain-containing protein [Acerihabitans sp. KWT182]|uniref:Ig-like domain-containing protein n=1 Tax=Acerihabitans sp. KWT182 TaxID=3157919 RepID=A0AAU7Q996_9GAMM